MPTRELDAYNPGHDVDWEGNYAAFTCPACSKVYIVNGIERQHEARDCPSCGKSTAQCTGGRLSGGSASITWLTLGGGKPAGFQTILGVICLVLGSMGLILGITFSTVLLVAQVIEGGFGAAATAFVTVFVAGGCLILAGVRLRY
jgi:predicted RNA-binding Zn-ribbon protein involved in translation (DUF1610 family)